MSDDLDSLDIDVRCVSVTWTDGSPEIVFTGCSVFEASGLLRFALMQLESDMFDEYGDDADDDDE